MILRKYGAAATIDGIPLVKRNSIDFKANPTLAVGDAKISKDGGAFANLTTLPSVIPTSGEFVEIALSATEMQAARIAIKFIDQTSPKEWEDQAVLIETYGHSSAQHEFDLDAASTPQTGDSFARLGAPAGASVSADVAAVKADTAAVLARLPSALVGGRMDANVGAMAADVVTASAIAPNAIGASELAADAVAEIQSGLATSAALATVQADTDDIQAKIGTPSTTLAGDIATVASGVGSAISGIAAVNADTDNIQTRLPAALVGGRIDANVGSMDSGVVTSSAIAPDAIGASELAADAIAEIQAGLSTSAALALVQADVDDVQSRLPAALVGGKMDSVVSGGGGGGPWSMTAVGQPRIERPNSGSVTYDLHLFVENSSGTPVNLDSTPTVSATQNNAADLSTNLSAVTNPDTGHYKTTYTVAVSVSLPIGVYVQWTGALGGVTKRAGTSFDVLTAAGQVFTMAQSGVNVSRMEGQTLSGKTGENFQAFFNNNGSDTTKIVQDTGGTATVDVTLGAIMAVSVVGNRVSEPLLLEMFQAEEKTFSFTILDDAGAPVSYAGKTLRFTAFDSNNPANAVFEVEGADITITGAGNNVINVKVQPSKSALANEELKFTLWDITNSGHEPVVTWGQMKILPAIKDV